MTQNDDFRPSQWLPQVHFFQSPDGLAAREYGPYWPFLCPFCLWCDRPVVRMGLIELISGAFEKVTFSEAKTAQEVLEQVRKHDWGLVILDISMPGRSGIDVLGELKKARPKIPVLVLSMHPEEQFARRALKAGASA